uniref:Growth-regulating factor n=1 Tax=Davidia involucrata TaxID=16924 RepID=A0A5B7B9E1_DAVIN
MESGNRNGLVVGGGTEKAAASLGCECDDGLVVKVQRTESFPCTKMMAMPHHPPYHHHPCESESSASGFGGGGEPIYCNTSNSWVTCVSDIYDVVGAGSVSGGAVAVPTTLHSFTSHTSFKSSVSAMDLRFSSGSDPEPWRCRRTDGKKWRCSRDVAPDHKYCERHTHKSRSRSRKPVESQLVQTHTHPHPHPHPPNANTNTTTAQAFQNPIFHFPTMLSAATYDQPRCTEWFMEGDTNPVNTQLQLQWQQSSRVGLKREEEEPMNPNSYVDIADGQRLQLNNEFCSLLGPNADHFIDAWSSAAEREEMSDINNRCSVSGNLPLSSLTLSMSGQVGIEENENAQMGLGVGTQGQCGLGVSCSWMGSPPPPPPGGPLGEALCLGIATTTANTSGKSSCEESGYFIN